MTRLATALLALLFLTAAAPVEEGHPALWRVTGKHCTIYLLGSVHILSPDVKWRDSRINGAIEAAGTYFFETETDAAAVAKAIANKRLLPAGQSLRAMLSPKAQKNLDADFAMLGLNEEPLDGDRPWLVSLFMLGAKLAKSGNLPNSGVDNVVQATARDRGKPIRYLESIETQIALLAPDDPKIELESFEIFLKEFRRNDVDLKPMVSAWLRADQPALARLLLKDLGDHPELRKALLDDRNAVWAKELEDVLDHESGTFLVTVGAGHLVTERGVPALLRKAGYTVEQI
ncbi:MAG: TraB/GumN family protein [Proteobacteria bacterium]|nr:TraB/GumN family protein [Pseudomonadota bacterium]